MRKLIIMSVLFFGCFAYKASAQVSVNINIGDQPDWGPYGYDRVQYYYLPDIDVYYDVMSRTYTYFDGRYWVTSTYLPYAYRNYDLYRGYKVVLNYSRPWLRNSYNRNYYARYRNHYDQRNLRDYRTSPAYSNSYPRSSQYYKRDNDRSSSANRNDNQRNRDNVNNNSRGRENADRTDNRETRENPGSRSESRSQNQRTEATTRTQSTPRTQSAPRPQSTSGSQSSSENQQRSRPSRG